MLSGLVRVAVNDSKEAVDLALTKEIVVMSPDMDIEY